MQDTNIAKARFYDSSFHIDGLLLTYKDPPTTERYQGSLSALTRIAILLSNQPVWILLSL